MTCAELTDFLSRYLDDELSAVEKSVFEQHLHLCPPCEAYLASFRETIRLGKEVSCDDPEAPVPEALVRAILAAREAAK